MIYRYLPIDMDSIILEEEKEAIRPGKRGGICMYLSMHKNKIYPHM